MNCTKEQAQEMANRYLDREFAKIQDMPLTMREHPITIEQCEKELVSLRKNKLSWKANSRIVRYFNKSITKANKFGKDSPEMYWEKLKNDKELFRKFLENRYRCSDYFRDNELGKEQFQQGIVPDFILGIGLTTSTVSPNVSIFKPSQMQYVLDKYAREFNEIFDPTCGYCGRLVGTLVCNKKYIGRDISDLVIEENKECGKWLESRLTNLFFKPEYDLQTADAFTSTGEYDCLITCPPYSDNNGKQIEEWRMANGDKITCEYTCEEIVDIFLKNYKCKRYILVLDDSISQTKYKDFIVEKFENVNYINSRDGKLQDASKNYEAIVIIDRDEKGNLKKYVQ